MALDKNQVKSWLGRELGTLALTALSPVSSETLLRTVSWANGLARLGVTVPIAVLYDFGVVMTSSESFRINPRRSIIDSLSRQDRHTHNDYTNLIKEISLTEIAERARAWKLSDDLITVLLAKLLGEIWTQWPDRHKRPMLEEFPIDAKIYENIEGQLTTLHGAQPDRSLDYKFYSYLVENRLRILTLVEGLDLDTLRLLGLFRSGDRMAGIVDITDLLGVLSTPQANDVVNFSLDVIPSVLETKRSSGMQTFSVDGYSGLTRSGNLDSLLLSELAHDDLVFEQRYVDNELYYYAHERQSEQMRRLHYIALDASASMRGEREVFARGLALALVKKLSLLGEDVYFRFFDSLLYDLVRVRGEQFDVPYLLCFRSERGRNYQKVFRMLTVELQRISIREHRKAVLYIITHAECHIPEDILAQLKKFAYVYGVFILPSTGELELSYLDQLDHHHVIDRATLLDRNARADKALEICDDAVGLGSEKTKKKGSKR